MTLASLLTAILIFYCNFTPHNDWIWSTLRAFFKPDSIRCLFSFFVPEVSSSIELYLFLRFFLRLVWSICPTWVCLSEFLASWVVTTSYEAFRCSLTALVFSGSSFNLISHWLTYHLMHNDDHGWGWGQTTILEWRHLDGNDAPRQRECFRPDLKRRWIMFWLEASIRLKLPFTQIPSPSQLW